MRYDAMVVGGGAAGLSAATWLGRFRRRTLIVDSGEYRNRWLDNTHGYLGCDGVEPERLLERAHEDLAAYPHVELRRGRVNDVRSDDGGGFLATVEGESVDVCRLVLATGVRDEFPDVQGFEEHYGSSVFHCPTCDGYEARDRSVVVFGWGEQITGFALELLDWATSVTVVTDGEQFEGGRDEEAILDRYGIEVCEDVAVRLVGTRGDLRAVELRGGASVPCTAAFFSIAHRPRTELAEKLGCEVTSDGYVVVDADRQTTVPGVFAAGDVTPGVQLLALAAAQGTLAGVKCAMSLRGDPRSSAVPASAPDVEEELPD